MPHLGPSAAELPDLASLDLVALALTVLAVACLRFKLGMVLTFGVAAAAGLALRVVGVTQ